ncbi:Hypothetical_protein [Hexamita inflata]|uniref:Hypothetical_protein n=1 Tax=Hexamita inflata TaxID=28002 RepID=A0AA86V5E8_9EUKA|nr:Hypothetical protein HINF_LOCUS34007 [Hexamita inflata]CAI9976902.1 Hypothetical protein HINF_LOCUS64547 [Hexamita inflata]
MVYIQISAFCQFSTEMEFDCLKCNFQTNQNHKIDHSSSNAINYRVFKVSLSCAVFCVISSVFAAFNYSVLQSWLQQNARSWLYDLVSKWSAISRKFLRCFTTSLLNFYISSELHLELDFCTFVFLE